MTHIDLLLYRSQGANFEGIVACCCGDVREYIRELEMYDMVYKAINGQAPVYLSSLFNSTSAVTNRMLRNSNLNLRPPRMKTTFGQNSFAYRGATIWNSLPNDCRTAHTFRTFKMKLKAMLA